MAEEKGGSEGISKKLNIIISIVMVLLIIASLYFLFTGKGTEVFSKKTIPEVKKQTEEAQKTEEITEPVEEDQREVETGGEQRGTEMGGEERGEDVGGEEPASEELVEEIIEDIEEIDTERKISIQIDDFTVEIEGPDQAKLTELIFTIVNEGTVTVSPYVAITLSDEEGISSTDEIEIDDPIIGGEDRIMDPIVNMPFDNIGLTKRLDLKVYEGGDLLASAQTEFVTEG